MFQQTVQKGAVWFHRDTLDKEWYLGACLRGGGAHQARFPFFSRSKKTYQGLPSNQLSAFCRSVRSMNVINAPELAIHSIINHDRSLMLSC